MKLEVGQFVRTNNGIAKIIGKNDDVRYYYPNAYISDTYLEINEDTEYLYEEDILKASHNIIDLIEVGDYVNGSKVYYCYCADEDSTGLFIDTEKGRQWLDKPSQIKTVVTKEQFESMRYVVNE